jgi:hypothetical protein
MDIGMLWFDNDPKSDLTLKVNKAAAYYRKKYGQDPNICFVHPTMLVGTKLTANNIEVHSNLAVLPHHFWIGVQKSASLAA